MDKEIKKLLREARKKKWLVTTTRNGAMIAPPYDPHDKVLVHGTPSDHRALENALSLLRKRGWDKEPEEGAVEPEMQEDEKAAEQFIDMQEQLLDSGDEIEELKKKLEAAEEEVRKLEGQKNEILLTLEKERAERKAKNGNGNGNGAVPPKQPEQPPAKPLSATSIMDRAVDTLVKLNMYVHDDVAKACDTADLRIIMDLIEQAYQEGQKARMA